MKIRLLPILSVICYSFTGCDQAKVQPNIPVKPTAVSTTPSLPPLAHAQSLYSESRFQDALQQLNQHGLVDPDALLLRGIIELRLARIEAAHTTFAQIPEQERQLMVESCLELGKLKSHIAPEVLSQTVNKFFSDCAAEVIGETTTVKAQLSLSRERILELGAIYEQRIGKTEDDGLRARIEGDFCKEFNLTPEELAELTTRYLEIHAERD